jgi:hypothetical protein
MMYCTDNFRHSYNVTGSKILAGFMTLRAKVEAQKNLSVENSQLKEEYSFVNGFLSELERDSMYL